MKSYKPTYEIIIYKNRNATVVRAGFGFCECFYGFTYKADAIRYVLHRGGKFFFTEWKNEIIGRK